MNKNGPLINEDLAPVPQDKAAGPAAANTAPVNALRLNATGRYRNLPLKVELVSSGLLPWAAEGAAAVAVPLTLDATIPVADARHLDPHKRIEIIVKDQDDKD